MKTTLALADSVDVLVLGGSFAATACAIAAAQAGQRVLLAAPRTGLGDDAWAHLRLDCPHPEHDPLCAAVFAEDGVARPLQIKARLEQMALEAGVDLLYQALPCGCLYDDQDAVCGAILATRSGRAGIAARNVVDASHTGVFARQAGVPFAPWPEQPVTVERRLLGAIPDGGHAVLEHLLPAPAATNDTPGEAVPLTIGARTLSLSLGDGSPLALAAAEAEARERCFHADQQGRSESIWFVPPAGCQAGTNIGDEWQHATEISPDAIHVSPRIWLLSPSCKTARSSAERLMQLPHAAAWGRHVGNHLQHTSASPVQPVQAGLRGGSGPGSSQIRGACLGLRGFDQGLPRLPLDDSALPVLGESDVLVAGGGTGGAPAAISAARAGARTLVLEQQYALGGVGTVGRIARYWHGNRVGFTAELDDLVDSFAGPSPYPKNKGAWWSVEWKQAALLQQLRAAGGEVCFHATIVAAVCSGNVVHGALVATPWGSGLITCQQAVDATGNADLAAAAGAACRVIGKDHVAVQGTGLSPWQPGADYSNSDHDFCDDCDARDITRLHINARAKFLDAWDSAPLVDSRQRRQIIGGCELGPLDILCDRQVPDAVVRASSNFDSHGFTIHPAFLVQPPNKRKLWAWIPYRSLIPQDIDGVIVTGLGMSAHRDALPVVRMQADVQNAGYAAGLACARAINERATLRTLDVRGLQEQLVAKGNLPPDVLTMEDDFPLAAETLQRLVEEELNEHRGIAACFAHPDETRPHLLRALSDPNRQHVAAMILGLLGEAAAAPILLADLQAAEAWDEGWHFRGMHQFGMSMSQMDAALVALALCGSADESASLLCHLAGQLQATSPFSHHRAVAWAAAVMAQRHPQHRQTVAQALARIVTLNGVSGHARHEIIDLNRESNTDINDNSIRERCLIELHLAVGLWRCGDWEQLGEGILKAYANDLRGHYARHARAVLAEHTTNAA
ncbi:MAG: FAD-dependent oxidoreductase [Planctomycetota bacterium]|nr:MAG: FAD-dependent oxidoreductase [Planctomycetota bacterium]